MDRLEMFKILMVMAAADGKFSTEETEILARRSHVWGLSDAQFTEAFEFAKGGATELKFPEHEKDRRQLLQDLRDLMLADGELAPREKKLYALAAAAMGLPAEDFDQ